MNAPSIDALLAHANTLPALPEIVRHLMRSLEDDEADVDTLVQHINTDPAIVARLLAAANSSAFGLASRVDSARQAILVLGVDRVVSIILATALVHGYDGGGAEFDARELWRHTLGVATCARVLAEQTGLKAETAFTAGLLHDIGQLLMHAAAPAEYTRAMQLRATQDLDLLAAENAVFGYDHAAAGGRLAETWALPPEIVSAIAAHHEPDRVSGGSSELGDLIHVAEVLSHALDLGSRANNRVPDLSERACIGLGLSWPAIAARFAEIEARYSGLRIALGI